MKVMKKQLKEELVALAEEINLLKGEEDVATGELKELSRRLYEKLTILYFTESNLLSTTEKSDNHVVQTAVEVEASEDQERQQNENDLNPYNPTGLEYNDSDEITEPNTEKIKDIVAQMPSESQDIDDFFSAIHPNKTKKKELDEIGGVHYDELPSFEKISNNSAPDKPRSVNERLKKGIHIGLNDRHAFIKHLFEGSNSDYNRVLSQLNTMKSKGEALKFVAEMVKPDYNNWEGKEEYEARFMSIIENKFQ